MKKSAKIKASSNEKNRKKPKKSKKSLKGRKLTTKLLIPKDATASKAFNFGCI